MTKTPPSALEIPTPLAAPKVPPAPPGMARKVRVSHVGELRRLGRPITMITAYDAQMAALADEGSVDIVLVGDSVGTVVHGFETTLPVTLGMMILHSAAVARGAKRPLIVTDLPFMSYQVSPEQALESAGRLVQEGNAEAVKLESVSPRTLPMIRAIVDSGIPVVGHVGLVPQSVHALSGYRMQGRGDSEAERILALAKEVEAAGAFAIVLESMPAGLGQRITESLCIPTIGIGAGPHCSGQVLVLNDVLGLTHQPPPFAKRYLDLRAGVLRSIRKYTRDVREGLFPERPTE